MVCGTHELGSFRNFPSVSIPERVWWFVELMRNRVEVQIVGVSIPERVWWFVELTTVATDLAEPRVSIPERVWWFVEPA